MTDTVVSFKVRLAIRYFETTFVVCDTYLRSQFVSCNFFITNDVLFFANSDFANSDFLQCQVRLGPDLNIASGSKFSLIKPSSGLNDQMGELELQPALEASCNGKRTGAFTLLYPIFKL